MNDEYLKRRKEVWDPQTVFQSGMMLGSVSRKRTLEVESRKRSKSGRKQRRLFASCYLETNVVRLDRDNCQVHVSNKLA